MKKYVPFQKDRIGYIMQRTACHVTYPLILGSLVSLFSSTVRPHTVSLTASAESFNDLF